MNVKSRIASFEAHNEEVRALSPRSHGSGASTPRGGPSPMSNASTPGLDDTLDSSPDRPTSTSAASQSRINRLQRQAAAAAAAAGNLGYSNLRNSPYQQNPLSPRGSFDPKQGSMQSTRRLMGFPEAKRAKSGVPASLFSHHKSKQDDTTEATYSLSSEFSSNGFESPGVGRNECSRPGQDSRGGTRASRMQTPTYQKAAALLQRSTKAHDSNGSHQTQQPMQKKEATTEHTSDGELLDRSTPHSHSEAYSITRPALSTRMSKIRRMHKIKSMEHVRRHFSRSAPIATATAEMAEPQTVATDFSSPRKINQTASPEQPNDDDITLTSVRQIVGTTRNRNPLPKEDLHEKDFPDQDMMGGGGLGRPQPDFEGQDPRLWREGQEEKSNKARNVVGAGLEMARSSSSDYSNGEPTRRRFFGEPAVPHDQSMSGMSASQMTPDVAVFFEQSRMRKQYGNDDDENTYDYGDRDDDSQCSLSYEQRRLKEMREREAREAAVAAAKAEMEGPFVQKEDVEHYRKTLDTPIVKTAAGVVGAATLGCIVLGPVGLLVGAAAVGIGVGVMQIPEEQRSNMCDKAAEAMKGAQESALNATEAMSHSCANTYRDSGIADHMPADLQSCYGSTHEVVMNENDMGKENTARGDISIQEKTMRPDTTGEKPKEASKVPSPTRSNRFRNKRDKISCLREGPVLHVNQIHALDPVSQPRAWLDVLASAETSHDEKIEAMEEILILAKDKQRARIFLEEGILDSIMWTLGRYFEKANNNGTNNNDWAHPEISREEANAAKLAATCCVTLGKAHCAAIHTEGDLLLMSLYERGTVPEERQLAQMLHEVPYHTRVTNTKDPTIVEPSKEVFALKQMSLPQAEELARSIKALADGR